MTTELVPLAMPISSTLDGRCVRTNSANFRNSIGLMPSRINASAAVALSGNTSVMTEGVSMRYLIKKGIYHTLVGVLASTLLWVGQGWAQVTVNVIASGNTGGSAAASLTIGATIASGSNTNLYVCVADKSGNLGTMSTVTWNTSESLTKLRELDASDIYGASLWRLKAPTAGSFNVVITPSASTNMAAVVVALDGVDQTTSERTESTSTDISNAAGTITVTAANSQSGDLVIDCVGRRQLENDTATVGSGQTEVAQSRANGFNDVGVLMSRETATGANTVMDWTMSASSYSYASIGMPIVAAGGTITREQEGFRWGVDDGNEAAHTWEANEDTSITIADNQARLLRALVNATGDPASAAYTLRAQKNGSGGYVAVPVGSTTAGSITNQTIAASSDDAQDIGGTVTLTGTTIGASLDATTEWVGLRFTNITIPKGATITSATIGVVPSATTEDEPSVTIFFQAADDCSTFTTGASDISGRTRTSASVSWSSTDLAATGSSYHDSPSLVTPLQEVIDRAGWVSGNDVCVIIQGGSTGTRDLTIEAYDLGPGTNPPRISIGWNAPNEVYIGTSGNIAAGGEATTARLTAPSGKTTSDFVTGRRWDDENGTDTIDITTDDYTEVEWLVGLSSAPVDGDYFDFRVYAGSSPLDTYTVTPRWTVGSGGAAPLRSLMLMGVGQ